MRRTTGRVPLFPVVWDAAAVRRALIELRLEHGYESVPNFADVIGVARTTVYRLENFAEFPDAEPSLETLRAWLAATSGESLGHFFGRFEQSAVLNSAGVDSTDESEAQQQPPQIGTPNEPPKGAHVLTATQVADIGSALLALSDALGYASNAIRNAVAAPLSDADETRPAASGGSTRTD